MQVSVSIVTKSLISLRRDAGTRAAACLRGPESGGACNAVYIQASVQPRKGIARPGTDTAAHRNRARFFFGLLRECLDQGIVTEDMPREEMRQNHVRHDAFEVLERTPPLAAQAY